jgi:hypothetical protein
MLSSKASFVLDALFSGNEWGVPLRTLVVVSRPPEAGSRLDSPPPTGSLFVDPTDGGAPPTLPGPPAGVGVPPPVLPFLAVFVIINVPKVLKK